MSLGLANLDCVYREKSIDWAARYDLQKMDERRAAYIAALKAADQDNFDPLLRFIKSG